MPIVIRPFNPTDEEYEAVVALNNTVWPSAFSTVETWQHRDQARDFFYHREVIEKNGEIVAFGTHAQWPWSFHPRKYWIDLQVHPAYERQGIGKIYYDDLTTRLLKHDPIAFTAGTRENKAQTIRFLEKRGFKQTMREMVSELDVTTFDETNFVGALEKVRQAGIQILSVRELKEIDPDYIAKLHETEWIIEQDVPSPDPTIKQSVESFEKAIIGNPSLPFEAWFIAVDNGQYVGMSNVQRTGNPKKFDTGLTGVLRSHRRMGIATALKLHAIRFAKKEGIELIETENEENNPMYQLNVQLGFKPQPAWVEFEKTLQEEEK